MPGNKKVKLEDALSHESHVKLDELVLLNGRFIEITNFVALGYETEAFINGETQKLIVPINVDLEEQHDKETQLPPEIEKLYFSNMYYSPFKMIKRIYSYARSLKIDDLLLKIIPFVSSNISLLYQIKSEIDTIILIYEKVKFPPKVAIFKQLDEMKNRLESVLELEEDELRLYFDYIDMTNKTKDVNKKIELLKGLNKDIKMVINYETIKYLNKVGLNPPPRDILPHDLKYPYVPRTVDSMPENPFKSYLTTTVS